MWRGGGGGGGCPVRGVAIHCVITVKSGHCMGQMENLLCIFDASSGSDMDCNAMTRGSIPGGDSVFTELHVLHKGQ